MCEVGTLRFIGPPWPAEGDRFDRVLEDAVTLPAALGGHDSLNDWRAIKESIPDAVDAFASPWNNIVVVLTPRAFTSCGPATAVWSA